MSETVQSEHSYFNHGIDDDDSSHSSSFKGEPDYNTLSDMRQTDQFGGAAGVAFACNICDQAAHLVRAADKWSEKRLQAAGKRQGQTE